MKRFNAFPKLLAAAFIVGLACFPAYAAPQANASEKLVVYTNIEPELLTLYAEAFKKRHPEITLVWVRDSAGPIAARLLAEKASPKADVIFGLALSALLSLEGEGVLEPYKAAGLENLAPGMYDDREHPVWTGTNGWGSGICVNIPLITKLGLPVPESWKDLTNPIYKNHIVAPSPVSSSTAYTDVSTWLMHMGEESGWQFMKALDANVKMYTHSGCKPAQMAAQGEFAIGISAPVCANPYLDRKAPVVVVIPSEGTGWDLEAAALVKGSKNAEAAKKLLDFASSPEVAAIGAQHGYIPARQDAVSPAISEARKALLPMDPLASAAMRKQVLETWRGLFEAR